MKHFKKIIKAISNKNPVKEYWTDHNVTLHCAFNSQLESLEYFHWRNDQYPNYLNLMPVSGFDGKKILDYGCGPGHDLVGFGTYSNYQYLAGVDISGTSVTEAKSRISLHGISADVMLLQETSDSNLPFEDESFDHIHCSGVLHHTPDPVVILKEMKRILKPNGTINIMVYNYDSIWLHLYVAYLRTLVQGLYQGKSLSDQFRHSTDGEDCPISNCYKSSEWIALCQEAGFQAKFTGAAVSVFELSILDKRFAAIMDRRLPSESRQFLTALKFNEQGIPEYQGAVAGIDACYQLSLK